VYDGEKKVKTLSAAAAAATSCAPFQLPPGCPAAVQVDCGGVKGDFVLVEGLARGGVENEHDTDV